MAAKIRKFFFWAHLCAGCIAGLVILIMSVTGVLLTYEPQMIAFADRSYRSAPPKPAAPRLPIETLLGKVPQASGISLQSDANAPAQVTAGRSIVFVDVYTGAVLGEGSRGIRTFFRIVTDWHRWLGATAKTRPTFRQITGVANLIFLGLLLSGLYLWIPRVWKWRNVKAVAWFRGGLTGKARDFNWHNVIGLWIAVPLLLIIVSGAVISFPWATNLIYAITGTQPPNSGPSRAIPNAGTSLNGIDRGWSIAEKQVGDWRSISLRLPTSPRAPLNFTIDQAHRGRPDKRLQLTVKRDSEEVLKRDSYEQFNTGRKVRTWLRWIHTGEAGGIPGQTLAGVASLGGAFLVWTGIALAWRRFRTWQSGKRKSIEVHEEVLAER